MSRSAARSSAASRAARYAGSLGRAWSATGTPLRGRRYRRRSPATWPLNDGGAG